MITRQVNIVSNEEIKFEGCSFHKQCTYHFVECTKAYSVDKCNRCAEFPFEKIFDKTVNSYFKRTGLLEYLVEKNISTVAVVTVQIDYCIDVIIKCGFEHGFKIIVPETANSTFDNDFMTRVQSYRYYNEFM